MIVTPRHIAGCGQRARSAQFCTFRGRDAYLAGRRVAEFNVPGEIGVVELSRAGHSKIPAPSTPLEDGVVLSFIVAAASLGRLRSFLGGKWS